MKWLILGGAGQLGRAMHEELSESGETVKALSHTELDITDGSKLERYFEEEKPEVVINAAAWTDVDGAELEEDAARLINAHGAFLVAEACERVRARLVHISTDYVFSGNAKVPWSELEPPEPISAYGRTKALGERMIQDAYSEGSYIVRTAWLYSPWGKNFAKTMMHRAVLGTESVSVVNDQFGQPTSALDLAAQIHRMVEGELTPGIYHGTNSGVATWFEFAQYIFESLGEDAGRVLAVPSLHRSSRAKRPLYSVLGHQHWFDEGMSPMRGWRDAFDAALPLMIDALHLED